MRVVLDWLPPGIFFLTQSPNYVNPRNDIEDEAEDLVLVHRQVAVPYHIRGPLCPCSPTARLRGEVDSSSFKYEVSTTVGGFH